MSIIDYSTIPLKKIFENLKTSKEGLPGNEVKLRLKMYGYNVLAQKKELGIVLEFLSHFLSPLIVILFFAAGISAYFGEITNAIIVGIMILASVTLDFFEEHSANNVAEKLREKVSITATVIRDGLKQEVKAINICVGDIIFLSSGDLIPADARIIESDDFFVNQSSLTGESFPREKFPAFIKGELDSNLVFLGSNVISGTALAVVFAIGQATAFGKISQAILGKPVKSEFELGINHFGFFITKVILFLVLFIFLFNALLHHNILESFLFAVAIAVGVTPEMLPMIMSITMARGSQQMGKKGVIVKKLSSIPSFGSMDVLCTDKTGTLTEDKIELVSYIDIFGVSSENVFLYTFLNSVYQTGVKNPLDKAILEYKKAKINRWKKIEEIPFDFTRKLMSIAVNGPDGRVLITKGAPEEVILRSKYYYHKGKRVKLTPRLREKAFACYHKLSAEGYRILAVAIKLNIEKKEKYTTEDESDLELCGFVLFLDPAKKDVKNILVDLEKRGIEIKIITGDNELVTQKICNDIGLSIKGVMLGSEIHELTDDALRARVERTTIFARFSPDDKNRIILALKSNGHVVGYLGDGINDAPSLKTADVGISVNTAVDIAKESADIILTHKSLDVIVEGVLEGRRSFGNTMKYILMAISSNFGNMFSVLGAIFYLPFLPMLPIQILLNNFIYDFSQITIPLDNVDDDWMDRPKKWDLKFVKKFMYTFGPISSLFDFLTFFVLYSVFHLNASGFQTGWFMESLATQTLVIHIIRTRKIPFIQSRAGKFLYLSTFSAIIVGWIIPYTALGKFFNFSALPLDILAVIFGLVVLYLILVEIVKRLFYRMNGL